MKNTALEKLRRQGYTLIETLACIALIGALLPTMSKTFISLTRLHAAQRANLDEVLSTQQLERDFRALALRTQAILQEFGPYRSVDCTLVLRTAEATEVLTVDAKQQPQRIVFTPQPDGQWLQRTYDYRVDGWAFRFAQGEAGHTIECFARREATAARPLRGEAPPRFHLLSALPALGQGGGTP